MQCPVNMQQAKASRRLLQSKKHYLNQRPWRTEVLTTPRNPLLSPLPLRRKPNTARLKENQSLFFRNPSTAAVIKPLDTTTLANPFGSVDRRPFSSAVASFKMASKTDTAAKHADLYKERNIDEVSLQDKVDGLSKFINGCKCGMMTTRDGETGMLMSRCMSLAATENGGIDLLFHTNTESGKAHDLASDAHVNISFLDPAGEWASISGTASVVTDRELIRKYYLPHLRAWMGDLGDGTCDGGPDDPRLGMIRVVAHTATYAVVREGEAGLGAQIARGMVTGSPPRVERLREIGALEVEAWRESQRLVEGG